MRPEEASLPSLQFHPLTLERWHDLESPFGERGACGGCWCMWWRLKRSEFEKRKGAGNRFEAEHLLARCGFEVENVYAESDRSPYGSKYPGELIFVARMR